MTEHLTYKTAEAVAEANKVTEKAAKSVHTIGEASYTLTTSISAVAMVTDCKLAIMNQMSSSRLVSINDLKEILWE